jgi:hypothetical protein
MGVVRQGFRGLCAAFSGSTASSASSRALGPVPEATPGRAAFQRWATATLAVLAVTVWLALAEVDRLVTEAATATGLSASASSLQAIDPRLGQENWQLWSTLSPPIVAQVSGLVIMYTVLDAVFAALYIALLWRFFSGRKLPKILLATVAAGELAQGGLQLYAALVLAGGGVPDILGASLAASIVKWSALGLLVIALFGYPVFRNRAYSSVRRAWQALFFQRLSVAVIVLIAALALLPIPGVTDQMPDTERAWAPDGLASAHFWLTGAAVIAVAAGLFLLGRRRSELAWDLYAEAAPTPKTAPNYWWWAYGPAVLLAAFLAVVLLGGTANWPNAQFWIFLAIPIGLAGMSMLIALLPRGGLPAVPLPQNTQRALDAWRCGDVLAILFLAGAGMALVRSFTAPVALAMAPDGATGVQQGWSPLFLVIGIVTVLAAFPVGAVVVGVAWGRFFMPTVHSGALTKWVTFGAVVLFAVVLALATFIPTGFSNFVGVAGIAVLAVGAWAMVIGFLIVALQNQRPLAVFERLGLRANPVLSLIAVILVLGSVNGGNPQLHAIRQLDAGAPGTAQQPFTRQTLDQRFASWLSAGDGCRQSVTVPVAGAATETIGVRPMVLVAAEGGGIRAATWTAEAFGALAGTGACGSQSVLFSSGVSGSSLGLSLVDLYGGSQAAARVQDIAQPQALAAAVAGAAVGDVIGSGTGLMVPSVVDGTRAWNDRAGLMESLWEQAAPRLAEPFSGTVSGPAGALILNSTDADTGCRLLVSQLNLPDPATPSPADPLAHPNCSGEQSLPVSIDLFDQQRQCPLLLRWSTAAMLSARFPIISPAGRVPALSATAAGQAVCQASGGYQAIDGGYSEGSGLGTVADVWPALQQLVLDHNSCVAAPASTACPAGPPAPAARDIIVPVFLFLQNSPGADVLPPPPKAAGELAVPLVGLNAKNLQTASRAWLQRLEGAANVCPGTAAASPCMEATAQVRGALNGHAAVVVAPNSVPALVPPLGWSLSPMSEAQLAAAMATEASTPAGAGKAPTYANLLALLRKAG